jgi:hypothetical protein
MRQRLIGIAILVGVLGSYSPAVMAAKPPQTWDGMTLVKSKKLDALYLMPGADFRPYSKVMLEPTEVAFQKNWIRDHNRTVMSPADRIDEADGRKLVDTVRTGFGDVFQKAYADAGYQVVSQPGPEVLWVRTSVANLYVAAPESQSAGRTRSFSREAGAATVILEVRDSSTGALLGRAIDSQSTGDTGPYLRNSVTNRADFTRLFRRWAEISVDGLAELKARSPIAAPAASAQR